MAEAKHEVRAEAALKKAGLKATLPRVKIYGVLLRDEDAHLSAEDVYKRLLDQQDEVGLATVYRVLTQLVEAGLLQRQNFAGGQATYELDSGQHHDHLVCTACGLVIEFFDATIEVQQRTIAKANGFELTDHTLTLYGYCPACQAI